MTVPLGGFDRGPQSATRQEEERKYYNNTVYIAGDFVGTNVHVNYVVVYNSNVEPIVVE